MSAGGLDVLVVGEINPDIIVADPDLAPVYGQVERIVESIRVTVGSSSAIVACGLATLGMDVAMFGVVGEDAFGRFMLEELKARGVDVTSVVVDAEVQTGATVILVRGPDRALLTAMGAIGAMDIDALPSSVLDRTRHVHVGSFFLQLRSRARLPGFFSSVRNRGLTTSFDTNWDPAQQWDGNVREMLRVSDLFFPNAVEACRIAQVGSPTEAGPILAALGADGRTDGGPTVIVKLGVDGASAYRADGSVVHVPAMPIQAVDSTGAGDAFDAGFVRAWLDGRELHECLRWGAACGALSTTAIGGVDGQPGLEQLRAALAAWPNFAVDRHR